MEVGGKRETCLSCERAGRVTRLVPYGHWNVCPRCEPQLAAVADGFKRLATMRQLINR